MHGANEPPGSRTGTALAAPGKVSPSDHRVTQCAGAVADVAVTTALFPARRTMVAAWMTARLLDVTSLTVVGIGLLAGLDGDPRPAAQAARVPRRVAENDIPGPISIPRSGSPSMAAGMVMLGQRPDRRRKTTGRRTTAGRPPLLGGGRLLGGGAGAAEAGWADARPAPKSTAAATAVIARTATGGVSVLRAMSLSAFSRANRER